jgi:transcriptional regulator with XRE-family HTH domain
MISKNVLNEARRQVGVLLGKLREERKISINNFSSISGMSEKQILDIELNRTSYNFDDFLTYIKELDMYFFLSEKEGHHLDFVHMLKKSNPDKAAL